MRVDAAKAIARHWVLREEAWLPGFLGAYFAGSVNWLPDDADLPEVFGWQSGRCGRTHAAAVISLRTGARAVVPHRR